MITSPTHVTMGGRDLNMSSMLNYKSRKENLHRPSLSPLSCRNTFCYPLIPFYYSRVDLGELVCFYLSEVYVAAVIRGRLQYGIHRW